MAILGWLAHLGSLEWRRRGKSQAGKCGLVLGAICHLLTTLVPNRIAVLPSIAILLEKGWRSCCLSCINFFTPQLAWSLWDLDIVFGGTLPQGWVMPGTLVSLSVALAHLLWTHLLRVWCSSALPHSQHSVRGSVACLQPLHLSCLLLDWKGPRGYRCPVRWSKAEMHWGLGCAEEVLKMDIAAAVVALE